jgi:hypothetical protein
MLLVYIDGDIHMPIKNIGNENSEVFEPSSVSLTKPIDINRNRLKMYDNIDSNARLCRKFSI